MLEFNRRANSRSTGRCPPAHAFLDAEAWTAGICGPLVHVHGFYVRTIADQQLSCRLTQPLSPNLVWKHGYWHVLDTDRLVNALNEVSGTDGRGPLTVRMQEWAGVTPVPDLEDCLCQTPPASGLAIRVAKPC